jgi:hypothetical protein
VVLPAVLTVFGMVLSGCNNAADNGGSGGKELDREAGENRIESPSDQGTTEASKAMGLRGSTAKRGTSVDARGWIDDCLGRYRKMARYEDQGQLRVAVEGSPTFTTPFRVAWERPNRLAVVTHNMTGNWTSTTWEAICPTANNPFPNQRLVRPLPDRIDLDWLLADSLGGLLSSSIGLPIQLELLLSNDSPEGFSSGDTQLEFLDPSAIDGRECEQIRVLKGGLQWVLWIDSENKLLRKMELPPQLFYPGLPSLELAKVRCEIELLGAKADLAIDWSGWQIAARPSDVAVRRFVMPPPIASTRILGTTVSPFDLKDPSGELLFDAAEPRRSISILCWIADDEASEGFVKDLMAVRKTLFDQKLIGQSQMLLIGGDKDTGLETAMKRWNCDLPLAIDRSQLTESLFKVPGIPSLVILDRDRRVQVAETVVSSATVASIPSLVARLIAKEDLASRQLQQDADNQARYVAALHRVAVDKAEANKLEPMREFQFAMHGMQRDWKVPFNKPLVSAGGAWFPDLALGVNGEAPRPFDVKSRAMVMAALDEEGQLFSIDHEGKTSPCATIDPDQADRAKRIHTSIDPWSQGWIAVIPEGLPRFWVTPAASDGNGLRAATTFNTQAAETPIGYAWTSDAKESKLAMVTSASRLLIIDPKTEQRRDATLGEDAIGLAPSVDTAGQVAQWEALSNRGRLFHISNLMTSWNGSSTDQPLEARLEQLSMGPEPGVWYWGRYGTTAVTLSLASLPSGETGVMVCNALHQTLNHRPLNARPDQTRLLGTTRLPDGTLYGVALGPSRVLHLFTADLRICDQVSWNGRILGAAIFPYQGDLKLVVALEDEISCWSIDVPDRSPAETAPAPSGAGASRSSP